MLFSAPEGGSRAGLEVRRREPGAGDREARRAGLRRGSRRPLGAGLRPQEGASAGGGAAPPPEGVRHRDRAPGARQGGRVVPQGGDEGGGRRGPGPGKAPRGDGGPHPGVAPWRAQPARRVRARRPRRRRQRRGPPRGYAARLRLRPEGPQRDRDGPRNPRLRARGQGVGGALRRLLGSRSTPREGPHPVHARRPHSRAGIQGGDPALPGHGGDPDRDGAAPEVRRGPVQDPGGGAGPLPDPDGGGSGHQPAPRRDPGRGRAPAEVRVLHSLLPLRGRARTGRTSRASSASISSTRWSS